MRDTVNTQRDTVSVLFHGQAVALQRDGRREAWELLSFQCLCADFMRYLGKAPLLLKPEHQFSLCFHKGISELEGILPPPHPRSNLHVFSVVRLPAEA